LPTKVTWEPFHPGHFAVSCLIIFLILSFTMIALSGGEPIPLWEWVLALFITVVLGAIFTSAYDDPYGVGGYVERRDC